MPVQASCQCGKAFQAPDHLAGKTVKCPACGQPLSIPELGDDLLGDLSDLEAAALQADASSSGTGLPGSSLQMSAPKKNASIPIAPMIAGGLIGVVCLVLIFILLFGGTGPQEDPLAGGPGSRVAQNNSNDQEDENEQADEGDAADEGSSNGQPSSATDNGGPGSRDPGGSQVDGEDGEPEDGEPEDGESDEVPQRDLGNPELLNSDFRLATLQWYGNDKAPAGARRPKDDQDGKEVVELSYSWMTELLPYVGQQDLYDKINFDKSWWSDENHQHAVTVVEAFLDPADKERQVHYGSTYFDGLALTHFVGMSGVEDSRGVVAATLPRSDPRAGIFSYGRLASIREITDGTSNTIMLVGSGRLAGPWVAAGGSTIRGAREPYFHELSGFGSLNHKDNKKGAITAFADGSVRWMDADIDPEVFRAMCTIHGGEAPGESRRVTGLRGAAANILGGLFEQKEEEQTVPADAETNSRIEEQ